MEVEASKEELKTKPRIELSHWLLAGSPTTLVVSWLLIGRGRNILDTLLHLKRAGSYKEKALKKENINTEQQCYKGKLFLNRIPGFGAFYQYTLKNYC